MIPACQREDFRSQPPGHRSLAHKASSAFHVPQSAWRRLALAGQSSAGPSRLPHRGWTRAWAVRAAEPKQGMGGTASLHVSLRLDNTDSEEIGSQLADYGTGSSTVEDISPGQALQDSPRGGNSFSCRCCTSSLCRSCRHAALDRYSVGNSLPPHGEGYRSCIDPLLETCCSHGDRSGKTPPRNLALAILLDLGIPGAQAQDLQRAGPAESDGVRV